MRKGRLLAIGFELGDAALMRRFAAKGAMPTLAGLLARGHYRRLTTPAEMLHVAAWPSLYTGVPPGGHGVYFTFQPHPGHQGWRRFAPGLYGAPTFWKRLDEAGIATLVFDAPYSHPEEGFGGAAVFDWGCWARYLEPCSLPSSLLRELTRAVGRYPLPWEAHALGFAPLDPDRLERELERALEARAEAALWLAGRRPWRLFFLVFGETHLTGHYLFGDEERLLRAHRRLDAALARILSALEPEDGILLVSADATKPNRSACHLLPQILARLGLYRAAGTEQGEEGEGKPPPGRRPDPLTALRNLLPKDLRKRLAGYLPRRLRERLAHHVDTAGVDWERTSAFPLPSDLEGLVRVNLEGREPLGTVAPGEAYERLLDGLEEALLELRDREGRRAVRRLLRADRAFSGPRRAYLPDLVVLWNEDAELEELASPRIGRIRAPSPDPRPGTHAGPGFSLLVAPGVEAGEGEGSVYDIAPSLSAYFGLPPPEGAAGRVLEEFSAFRGETA